MIVRDLRFRGAFNLIRRLLPHLPLAALALLIIWPGIRYGPANLSDWSNHLYRLVELEWHFRHGDFYPRWFSDLHYGFGAPVLNFYAPLSYYVLLAIRFAGVSFAATLHIGFLLSAVVATFGAYHWGRDQFDSPAAGVISAVAYGMSPYMYFNLLSRASLPEIWALAIAPWLFWSALRLVRQPSYPARLTFTLLYAALILTHNLSALLFTPLLALYCPGLLLEKPQGAPGALAWLGLSTVQAIGLSAFFVAPFLLESQYVQLYRAALPEIFQYQNNFLEWRTLFSPPIHFDPYHVLNVRPMSLAWPPLLLAVAAIGSWRKNRRFPILSAAFTLSLIVVVALMNRISRPVWDVLPLASLLQFQWRLMGPAILLIAWLAAAGLPQGRWQWPMALVFVVGNFFFTLTWTYHEPYEPPPQDPTPADAIRYEIAEAPFAAGTTYSQEFLPRWVQEMPPSDIMLPRYSTADIPSRLATTPPGVTIISQQNGVKSTDLIYDAPDSFTAVFNIFYFPGWTATVDGQPAPLGISSPNGLITVELPAGRHNFRLALLPTPPQVIGSLISLLASLALFIPSPAQRHTPIRTSELRPALTWLFVGLLGLWVVVLDRVETPFYHTELDNIPHPLAVNFGDQLSLIGYNTPQGDSFVSGETLKLTLYWQAIQPLAVNYQTTVQLIDQHGNRFGQSDNQHPALMPTSNWKPGQYAIDGHQLESLSGTPPGEYHLVVGVYQLTEGGVISLNVMADSAPAGIEYDLGPVIVARARLQSSGPLRLIDSSLAAQTIGVGDRLPFTTVWDSGPAPAQGLTAHLMLTDANGQVLFSTDFPPAGPDYPSDQWTPNELIRHPHAVDLPPHLPGGPARATISLLNADRSVAAGPFELGWITITVPDRSFAAPPVTHPVNYDFEGVIRLLGYDLNPGSITLYWQGLKPIPVRLTVFVHRLDASGIFLGGHDSPPPRPTTSWLPGEVIVGTHPIEVGEYFQVGLYDPVTGERFGEPVKLPR